MRKTDVFFFIAVLCCAGFFVAITLGGETPSEPGTAPGGEMLPADPLAGTPRDVDMGRLERLMDAGQLSEQEALHYTPVMPAPAP